DGRSRRARHRLAQPQVARQDGCDRRRALRGRPLRPEDGQGFLSLRTGFTEADPRSGSGEADRGEGARARHQPARHLRRRDHRTHALSDDQRGRPYPRREDRRAAFRHRHRLDQWLRLPDRQGRADVLGRHRRSEEDRRAAEILARQDGQGRVQAGRTAQADGRGRRQFFGPAGGLNAMNLAAAPWRSAYPPGLAPDVEPAAFPVHEIVDRAAARWGSKAAFGFRDTVLGYDALAAEVELCAAAFVRNGIASGSRVALLLPNTLYHPITFFGALKAGAAVVHLSPLDSERVLAHKLADSGAR